MTKPVLPTATFQGSSNLGRKARATTPCSVVLAYITVTLCHDIAYPNRINTSCTHPRLPTQLQCATHPAMQSGHVPLLPLLFGSFSSRSTVAHLKFAYHKKFRNKVA